jgi:hypothetical protein
MRRIGSRGGLTRQVLCGHCPVSCRDSGAASEVGGAGVCVQWWTGGGKERRWRMEMATCRALKGKAFALVVPPPRNGRGFRSRA